MKVQKLTPFFIAKYSDFEFQRGLKQVSPEELDKRLTAIVDIFCCLEGRDAFIQQYGTYLAHRLLNKTCVSNEAEELMIKKIQVEVGHH
jgi:hypothetical protein